MRSETAYRDLNYFQSNPEHQIAPRHEVARFGRGAGNIAHSNELPFQHRHEGLTI